MGGEGSMAGANISLKNNRSGLPSKKQGGFKDSYSGASISKKEFIDIKVSPEELQKIKTEIRQNAREEKKKQLIIFAIVSTVFITTLLILIKN